MPPPKQEIRWEWVLHWLRVGKPCKDIASAHGLSRSHFARRAKEELPPDLHAEYVRLANANRPHWPAYAKCGTLGGYQRHLDGKTVACRECLDAISVYQEAQRRRKGVLTKSEEAKRRHREGILGKGVPWKDAKKNGQGSTKPRRTRPQRAEDQAD